MSETFKNNSSNKPLKSFTYPNNNSNNNSTPPTTTPEQHHSMTMMANGKVSTTNHSSSDFYSNGSLLSSPPPPPPPPELSFKNHSNNLMMMMMNKKVVITNNNNSNNGSHSITGWNEFNERTNGRSSPFGKPSLTASSSPSMSPSPSPSPVPSHSSNSVASSGPGLSSFQVVSPQSYTNKNHKVVVVDNLIDSIPPTTRQVSTPTQHHNQYQQIPSMDRNIPNEQHHQQSSSSLSSSSGSSSPFHNSVADFHPIQRLNANSTSSNFKFPLPSTIFNGNNYKANPSSKSNNNIGGAGAGAGGGGGGGAGAGPNGDGDCGSIQSPSNNNNLRKSSEDVNPIMRHPSPTKMGRSPSPQAVASSPLSSSSPKLSTFSIPVSQINRETLDRLNSQINKDNNNNINNNINRMSCDANIPSSGSTQQQHSAVGSDSNQNNFQQSSMSITAVCEGPCGSTKVKNVAMPEEKKVVNGVNPGSTVASTPDEVLKSTTTATTTTTHQCKCGCPSTCDCNFCPPSQNDFKRSRRCSLSAILSNDLNPSTTTTVAHGDDGGGGGGGFFRNQSLLSTNTFFFQPVFDNQHQHDGYSSPSSESGAEVSTHSPVSGNIVHSSSTSSFSFPLVSSLKKPHTTSIPLSSSLSSSSSGLSSLAHGVGVSTVPFFPSTQILN
eukprot:TRINITY_DN684_c0_g2_i1.p1 TRINITY_DN684_c0_g2~~TRINITY_DN684_c0_g2_i1.p1  ORF type:complete len:682 (-),score=233.62 TRINITY_DN684_c0_g2_i1:356-2341(-)